MVSVVTAKAKSSWESLSWTPCAESEGLYDKEETTS